MKVIVTEKCSRCKRENSKEIESTEIAALEQEEERRTTALRNLQEVVKTWPQDDIPQLIVYFRGKLHTIDKICEKFCEKTIQNHVDEMFREIDPTKRKPRKPNDTEDAKDTKDTKEAKDAKGKDAKAKDAPPPAKAADKKAASGVQGKK